MSTRPKLGYLQSIGNIGVQMPRSNAVITGIDYCEPENSEPSLTSQIRWLLGHQTYNEIVATIVWQAIKRQIPEFEKWRS
jgi:hypothetical protein